jgi:hypothetical protein
MIRRSGDVVTGVAGEAFRRCPSVPCRMTTVARHSRVRASQRETRLAVVVRRRCPGSRRVTAGAYSGKPGADMIGIGDAVIVAGVTRKASGWRAGESGRVATVARYRRVRSREGESGEIMIV